MKLEPGCIVRSIAGHDAGQFYMAVECGQRLVAVADGAKRTLGAPKRKNIRHLRKTNTVLDLSGIKTDEQLRAALRRYQLDEGGL